MNKNVELRLEYVKLIQQGEKSNKSQNVLEEIWSLKGQKNKPAIVKVEKPIKVEIELKKKEKEEIKITSSLDELESIKGIGRETVKDIKLIYKDLDSLISALKSGKNLPLRNDVEKKIKRHFNLLLNI